MVRFTPVRDPEKARSEQDENELRKHRRFDAPFSQLKDDLNEKERTPRGDLEPMGRQTGDLYQDENKLWRKKSELFDKQKTWGRETFNMGNQEQANVDGKKTRDHMAEALSGRAIGFKGGRGSDTGDKVIQRNEVEQALVKNEKGLWVKKKTEPTKDEALAPVTGDNWRCPKCKEENIRKRHLCKECGYDRSKMAEESGMLRAAKPGEDPRLEAAKKKGRGTADASQQALKALEERRNKERHVQDEMGLTARPQGPKGGGKKGLTLNSSAQQVKPSHRAPKYKQWQGVQRSDEEARKVVEKALGESAVGGRASSSGATGSKEAKPEKASPNRKRSRSPRRRSMFWCQCAFFIV